MHIYVLTKLQNKSGLGMYCLFLSLISAGLCQLFVWLHSVDLTKGFQVNLHEINVPSPLLQNLPLTSRQSVQFNYISVTLYFLQYAVFKLTSL